MINAQPTDCQSDRYLQEVFTNIVETPNLTFSTNAPNVAGFNEDLDLDFYEPDPSQEYLAKRPLVLMIFGGSFLGGSRNAGDIDAMCRRLAKHGYVCAAPDYRLDNVFSMITSQDRVERAMYRCVQDAHAAIRYLLEDPNNMGFNIDPDHIYVGGASAGAIGALHLAYMDNSELLPSMTSIGTIESVGNNYVQPFKPAGVIDLWGALLDINMIDAADNIPTVIIHGEDDTTVPYDTDEPYGGLFPTAPTMFGAVPIDAQMSTLNICHNFHPYPGEGHTVYGGTTSFPNQYWDPIFFQVRDFLYDKTLVYDSPLPAGLLTVCDGATETYQVSANANSIFCWDVVNGTIVSTNNNQVTVQWNNSTGYLTVTETNCIDVVGTPQTIEVVPGVCCAGVDLDILFDGFPAQTSWDITDANGAIMASGGNYGGMSGNTTTTETNCLADGCYTLNFYDALNNGMCPFRANAAATGTFITSGTTIIAGSIVASFGLGVTPGLCGNYNLKDSNGTVLASGGGGFGAQQNSTFCLLGGVASKTTSNTNVDEMDRELLMVYPTLTSNFINLVFGFDKEMDVQIAIYDMSGKLVQQYDSQAADSWRNMQLNVSDFERGSYFIRMISQEGAVTKRFIKH